MAETDIQRGQAEKLLRIQRDLGIALSATSDQKEALRLILDATCRIEGIDCGGIYLFDKTTGSLELIVHRGLPDSFIEMATKYPPNAPQVKMLMSAKPIYGLFPEISCHSESECTGEGLQAIAVIPVMDRLKVIGALNLASHSHAEIPHQARHALESIASQIGGVFSRLESETLLRESQQDLQTLFDSIEDCVFILDFNGNILGANPAVENRLGYTADELTSMTALELHPPERRDEAAAVIKEMMDGNLTECPVPLLAKGGVIIPVETKVTRGWWRGRDVLIGISRDITRRKKVEDQLKSAYDGLERRVALRTAELAEVNEDLRKEIAEHKQTEAKLLESEANYRDLFNAEPDAIIITEVENKKIIDANPAALNLYGYRYEEMCGLSALSLSAEPDKSERHINTVAKELVGGHTSTLAYRLHKRANGTVFPVEITAGIYNHKGRKLVCAMIRDITAREKAEESLKNAYRIIERSYAVAFLWQNSPGWPVQFVTENVAAVFGYSAADFMSGKTSYRAVVHPDDLGRVEREVKGYSSGKSCEEFTHKPYRIIKKNGAVIWVEDKTFIQRDTKGTITHYQGIVSDITEKHQAEELIKDSEARYRSFVQNFHGIVFRGQLDFTPIFMHGAIEEITGYSEDELVNGSIRWDQLIHPDDLTSKIESTAKINTVPAYHCETEYRILRKDGTVRWVHEYVQNVSDTSGKPSHVQGALYDVTDRKQIEEALKQSEQNYRMLIENQTDLVVKIDSQGKFLFVSPSYCEKFGKTEDELLGSTFLPLVHSDDREATTRAMENLHRPPFTAYMEQRALTKDGWRSIAWVDTAILDENNAAEAFIGVGRDITERKIAQEALEAEKERLAVTLRSIGDGVITTDRNGQITLINKMAENLTGWTEDSALGQPISKVLHIVNEQTREPCVNPVQRVIDTRQIIGLANNTLLIRKDGKEFIIADSGAPIIGKGGEVIGVVLVFRDITEKRQMQQERLKIQKLESLGVLAGGIAHDFNNFLTGIIGNLSLVKLDIGPASSVYDSIMRMESAALRAKNLTQQLLTFSKGGEPVKASLDLPELLKEAVEFSLRGSNLKCDYDFSSELKSVEADAGQINQVINNLVINAVQATPQGGLLKLSAENVALGIDNAENLTPGEYVKIAITDQGVGIPAAHFDRIFDPYFTTKQKGSGLGLTVAFSIIDKHDGRITVASESRAGTTFQILLPASAKTVKQAVESEKKIFKGKGRILVMDDEILIRDVAARFLKIMGFESALAEDGGAALDMYRNAKESGHAFDAVIMDLTIPGGMGGKETVQKLLAYDPKAVAIVSSGYSNDPIMSDCETYGFKGVVTKPFRIEELSDALRVLFEE